VAGPIDFEIVLIHATLKLRRQIQAQLSEFENGYKYSPFATDPLFCSFFASSSLYFSNVI
jgi:hypothetical protein